MDILEVNDVQRTGSEQLARFESEGQERHMESALSKMFPELEIAALVSTPEPEQAEAPLPIRVRKKSEWDAGMVLEAWVKNTTGRKQPLSVQLSLASAIEEVWGGTYEVNGSDYIITSDKAIEPGEEWDPTIKVSGSDHGYQFKSKKMGRGRRRRRQSPCRQNYCNQS